MLTSAATPPPQVPAGALAIFQHTDRFRQQIGSLDLVASLYNKLQRTTLPVEWPLVAGKLEAVGELWSWGLGVGRSRGGQCQALLAVPGLKSLLCLTPPPPQR
jgi:hypothetical protein